MPHSSFAAAAPRARLRARNRTGSLTPYLLLAPTTVLFAVFMFYPLLYTLYLSFFKWNMTRPTKEFVGLGNYTALFTDPAFGKILGNTALYILLLLIFDFAAPYIFSFILSFVIRAGKNFYKGAIFLPSVISLVVGTMIFVWLLNPLSGPVALLFKALGRALPIWSNTQGLVIVVPAGSRAGAPAVLPGRGKKPPRASMFGPSGPLEKKRPASRSPPVQCVPIPGWAYKKASSFLRACAILSTRHSGEERNTCISGRI